MRIREALPADIPALCSLLEQLGYPAAGEALAGRLKQFSTCSASGVFVYDAGGWAVGAIVIHLLPQLILEGDVMLISCLVVDRVFRGTGIGSELEDFACRMARKGKVGRIVLHCDSKRVNALGFYARRGYTESRKFLVKIL